MSGEIRARYGYWYGREDYIGPEPTWPGMDDEETHADYIVRNDVPALLAAVDAVLAVHVETQREHTVSYTVNDPGRTYYIPACAECQKFHGRWPCPTVRAITAHLDIEPR